ncbi:hypothetical protein BV898_04743 [Hypsibius exemplaris]|uniref:Uncharacterized protein n=1 Tax=Hypsibius exemplaris TaxID=2072580 RepID=A0A1W0X1D8_HYPEX|nr:hypothetical protein BV898_04743 [Hypsibius exemplaris]
MDGESALENGHPVAEEEAAASRSFSYPSPKQRHKSEEMSMMAEGESATLDLSTSTAVKGKKNVRGRRGRRTDGGRGRTAQRKLSSDSGVKVNSSRQRAVKGPRVKREDPIVKKKVMMRHRTKEREISSLTDCLTGYFEASGDRRARKPPGSYRSLIAGDGAFSSPSPSLSSRRTSLSQGTALTPVLAPTPPPTPTPGTDSASPEFSAAMDIGGSLIDSSIEIPEPLPAIASFFNEITQTAPSLARGPFSEEQDDDRRDAVMRCKVTLPVRARGKAAAAVLGAQKALKRLPLVEARPHKVAQLISPMQAKSPPRNPGMKQRLSLQKPPAKKVAQLKRLQSAPPKAIPQLIIIPKEAFSAPKLPLPRLSKPLVSTSAAMSFTLSTGNTVTRKDAGFYELVAPPSLPTSMPANSQPCLITSQPQTFAPTTQWNTDIVSAKAAASQAAYLPSMSIPGNHISTANYGFSGTDGCGIGSYNLQYQNQQETQTHNTYNFQTGSHAGGQQSYRQQGPVNMPPPPMYAMQVRSPFMPTVVSTSAPVYSGVLPCATSTRMPQPAPPDYYDLNTLGGLANFDRLLIGLSKDSSYLDPQTGYPRMGTAAATLSRFFGWHTYMEEAKEDLTTFDPYSTFGPTQYAAYDETPTIQTVPHGVPYNGNVV